MFNSYELPPIGLTEPTAFSLMVSFYENEMDKRICGDTSKICEPGMIGNDGATYICNRLVPVFMMRERITREDRDYILNAYEEIKSPCSVMVDNVQELETMVLDAYRVSYAHYILGRKNKIRGSFPNYCCGISSENVMLSLMKQGYPNAMVVGNNDSDHYYVALPFVFEKCAGVIISDPTSDQLWENHKNKPRNMVSVIFGDHWDYITDWDGGSDLFPNTVEHLDHLRNAKLKKDGLYEIAWDKLDIQNLLREAFSNPVQLKDLVQYRHPQNYEFGC